MPTPLQAVRCLPAVKTAIQQGRPFKERGLIGYRSKGGTYIIATDGALNDDRKPHDLIAIIPWQAEPVVVLRPTANPELVAEVAEMFA